MSLSSITFSGTNCKGGLVSFNDMSVLPWRVSLLSFWRFAYRIFPNAWNIESRESLSNCCLRLSGLDFDVCDKVLAPIWNCSDIMAWRKSPLLMAWYSSKISLDILLPNSDCRILLKQDFIFVFVTAWICINWTVGEYNMMGSMRRSKSSGLCFPSDTLLKIKTVEYC